MVIQLIIPEEIADLLREIKLGNTTTIANSQNITEIDKKLLVNHGYIYKVSNSATYHLTALGNTLRDIVLEDKILKSAQDVCDTIIARIEERFAKSDAELYNSERSVFKQAEAVAIRDIVQEIKDAL